MPILIRDLIGVTPKDLSSVIKRSEFKDWFPNWEMQHNEKHNLILNSARIYIGLVFFRHVIEQT